MGCGAGGSCTPRPPIRQQPAPETRVVAVVFLGLLLDLLAFTLLLPLLPGLLESRSCKDGGQPRGPGPGLWGPPPDSPGLEGLVGSGSSAVASRSGRLMSAAWASSLASMSPREPADTAPEES